MTRYEYLRIYKKTTQGQPIDIVLEQAFWRVGWLDLKGLENVATQLMVEGYDSPTLVQLAAGLAESYTVEKILNRMLTELGQDILSVEQAGLVAAKQIASNIVSGELTPDAGIRLLEKLYIDIKYPPYLTQFYVLAEYLDGCCGMSTDECRREIIAEANRLLETGT